jgi:hypothetical protein
LILGVIKLNELILLGAGASVEADIPGAYRMTEVILEKFKDYSRSINSNIFERVANFVIGGLLFQKSVKGQNPLEAKVDIEEFFNAILLLLKEIPQNLLLLLDHGIMLLKS